MSENTVFAIDDDVRSLLLSSSDLVSVVGDAIYPLRAPNSEEFPRVVFWWPVYPVPIMHMRGASSQAEGRLQVDCYSKDVSPATSIKIRQAILGLLPGYRGIVGQTVFGEVAYIDGQTLTESPGDGSNIPIDRTILEFSLLLKHGIFKRMS